MKKGISLIVLVITIIVIIILAGAVILSLANNNPIAQANQATRESDADAVQSALSMYVGKIMAEYKGPVKIAAGAPASPTAIAGVEIQSMAGEKLWRNGSVSPVDIKAQATTPGAGYTQITITAADLGLASFPTYSGYTLKVDQNGDVTWTQP